MTRTAKPNRVHKQFQDLRLSRAAPALNPEPMPTIAPAVALAAAESDQAPSMELEVLVRPPAPSLLQQGEEGRVGKRKNKRVRGLIRGGRNSPDWGTAEEHIGAKVPAGFSTRVAELALAHKLHKWQVLVEALDCFIRRHGQSAGSKGQG